MNGRKEHTERTANSRSLHKVSISRIKKEMHDVSYLSDDMVITSLDAQNNTTSAYSVTIDGFAVIIMMQGEATVSIDMETYVVRPNMVVFFNPDSVIRTVKSSPDAMAYCLAFSKSFVNEIQIDISTSLPIYMRFGKDPVLKVTEQDVSEIRQLFRLVKTMLQSDKERYRHEIIRTLFTAVFYIITEINLREQKGERKQGRCEVIFEEFKGTGNMELKLDRALADRRIFPAIDPISSGTRKEELLLEPQEAPLIWAVRRILSNTNSTERAMDMLIKSLKQTNSNQEFLIRTAKKAQTQSGRSDDNFEL